MEDHINYPFEAEYEVRKKSGGREWKQVQVINNETDESTAPKILLGIRGCLRSIIIRFEGVIFMIAIWHLFACWW